MKPYPLVIVALLAVLCAPAWAINKCTGADGKVAFQDAPCANASKVAEQVKTWGNTGNTAEAWRFSENKDSMTGREFCFVVSPIISTGYRGNNSGFAHVWFQIAMNSAGSVALTARTSEASSSLFHNDISDMGVKVDEKEFTPFNQKINAHAVGFSDASTPALLSQLETGSQLRMRLRFWPYDQLHDTPPMSMVGFKPVFAQAKACAKR
ncbi:MAG: hypothetical protein A2503_10065 [Burkholderiales bacterium RIFOXYD12_FULL_59_19]|nr:MAG: hypothetical protein A2503_10065 [Burkholderiales bacterium RIFOXYD12_FULL_59_19]